MISQSDLRILVVGEREENRQVARWMLNRAFAQPVVLEAANDAEMQAVFADERVDCILVDEELSDLDDLLNSLALKSKAHVPIVFITADDSTELRTQAEARGVEHWLSKDSLCARTVELTVQKAIDVSALRLMLEEQGRELDRLRAAAEARAVEDAQATADQQTDENVDSESPVDPHQSTIEVPNVDLIPQSTADDSVDVTPVKSPAQRMGLERPKLVKNLSGVTIEDHDLATQVQRELMPPGSPAIEGFDIAGLSIPALRTGGDYYDYLPLADDLLTITIGECSGQGVAPAMMMASLRAYLRVISTATMDVEETISQANQYITEDIQDEEFIVTLMVAQIDQLSRSLRYASAGQQAHILDRKGEVDVLGSTGMPMGLQRETIIPEGQPRKLKSGDILLLSTDGAQKMVSDDGESFGMQRIFDVILANRNLPARMIVNFLQKECRAFADPQSQTDDVTFVVVKSEGVSYL
jgi:serine phosphatase RsbU (regulator of sigma subunit)